MFISTDTKTGTNDYDDVNAVSNDNLSSNMATATIMMRVVVTEQIMTRMMIERILPELARQPRLRVAPGSPRRWLGAAGRGLRGTSERTCLREHERLPHSAPPLKKRKQHNTYNSKQYLLAPL